MDLDSFSPHLPQTQMGPRLCDILNYGYDIGLDDYPIYDESDRSRLNQAIVEHFYTREIAAETPALFIFQLNRQMREQMPQINEVYGMLHGHDLMSNQDTTARSTSTGSTTGTDDAVTKASAGARVLNSSAPQVSMVGKDEMDYYDTGTGSVNTSSSDTTSKQQTSTSGDMSSSTSGRVGLTVSDLVERYYNGYNNTDIMVFDALEPCFSQLWTVPMPTF